MFPVNNTEARHAPTRGGCAAVDTQLVSSGALLVPFAAELDRRIVGASPPAAALKEMIALCVACDSTVLITGESGTGKELVARAIHDLGARSAYPFKALNCGAVGEQLLESELFGYERGAFTGAAGRRDGLFVAAARGTVFLDEFGEMTPAMQVKLLRVLQERVVRPLGSNGERPFDARVIVATNRDLERQVRDGQLREDLYYRVNVLPVRVPTLRERRSDIPQLVRHLLPLVAKKARLAGPCTIMPEALLDLCGHDWPGNVRELENTLERLSLLAGRDPEGNCEIGAAQVEAALTAGRRTQSAQARERRLAGLLDEIEEFTRCQTCRRRARVEAALVAADGNRTQAAALLGMKRSAFSRMYKRQRGASDEASC